MEERCDPLKKNPSMHTTVQVDTKCFLFSSNFRSSNTTLFRQVISTTIVLS